MGVTWRPGEEKTAQVRRGRVVAWRCRLKREDCSRANHDSAFSDWKILIGPSDWENYALGINGAERYRTSNLSQSCSCAGVYELGVVKISSNSRRIDHKNVVVVYLGQAENVRTRLQHYGRTGSHLERGDSTDNTGKINQRKPGLFTEVFSKGFCIVFRWAPMKSKIEAVNAEASMLEAYDYAWNRIGNAVCRYEDINLKLYKITRPGPIYKFFLKLKLHNWNFSHRPLDSEFSPKNQKSIKAEQLNNFSGICGATNKDGSLCMKNAVPGRRRCDDHKGCRVMRRERSSKSSNSCGVILADGSVCSDPPLKGRKRCHIHKGRRLYSTS